MEQLIEDDDESPIFKFAPTSKQLPEFKRIKKSSSNDSLKKETDSIHVGYNIPFT